MAGAAKPAFSAGEAKAGSVMRLRSLLFPVGLIGILALLIVGSIGNGIVARQGWGLLTTEMVLASLALFYWSFEQGPASSREVALIATLGTLAAVGRVAFAPLPGIQPTTFLAIISGLVLGPRTGFMVGSTAALVSNFFLGQGPWTPWQMFAWGLAGASGGWVGKLFPRLGPRGMAAICFLWGYGFGWIMNVWSWAAFVRPLTWQSFAATYAASFWFDSFHALGNAAFCLALGETLVKVLVRFRRRLKVA